MPWGGVLEWRETLRRPIVCIVMLATMLCLWTVVAYAITLHVTDDAFTQKEVPNALSGAAVALSIDNRNLNKEHIVYALFDLSLLPPNAPLDKAVLRSLSRTLPGWQAQNLGGNRGMGRANPEVEQRPGEHRRSACHHGEYPGVWRISYMVPIEHKRISAYAMVAHLMRTRISSCSSSLYSIPLSSWLFWVADTSDSLSRNCNM